METLRGMLIDIDYVTHENQSEIRVFVKTVQGVQHFFDPEFHPHFFVTAAQPEKAVKELESHSFADARIRSVKAVQKSGVLVLKISFDTVEDLTKVREEIKERFPQLERFEYDIPFANRYLVDKQLRPMGMVEVHAEKSRIRGIAALPDEQTALDLLCVDIETASRPGIFSDAQQDSIVMLGIAGSGKTLVFSDKKIDQPYALRVHGEREIIDAFVREVKERKPDVLVTYNGDLFDFPYLKDRAQVLGTKLSLGVDGSEPQAKKKGLETAVRVRGVQHLDAYQFLRLLARLGVVNVIKFDLESVAETLFSVHKEKVSPADITAAWKTGKGLARVADYNREDVEYTLRIAEQYLPLGTELAKLVKRTLFDVTRASASMLVEDLLVDRAFQKNVLVNNRPKEGQVQQRMVQSYAGGYVKEPLPGLHENIAVLDFSSLHPTIMISHNISPETLMHGKKGDNCSPNGYCFSRDAEGFISGSLKELFETRMSIKKRLKQLDKTHAEYLLLNARQHALKIIMNSFYGYLGYPRSRWYSLECASAVTAWSRKYVQEVAEKGEAAGFTVLYGDSITADRFVTIRNPHGYIEVKNVEALFTEYENAAVTDTRGKQAVKLFGYEALSVNPESRKTEWKPLQEIIRHKTDKRVYRVCQKFGETIVTEDHSIMVDTGTSLHETKPIDMQEKSFFVATHIPSAKDLTTLDMFNVIKGYERAFEYKGRIKVSVPHKDYTHVWVHWQNHKNPVKMKRFITVGTPEFNSLCKLLGAYLAEGSSSTQETTDTRYGASIASSDVPWLTRLQKDYARLFTAKTAIIRSTPGTRTLTYIKQGRAQNIQYVDETHKLQMMNTLSALVFKGFCGQKSDGKYLPGFIFNVPAKYKKIMLKKMIEGDGSHSVNTRLGYSEAYIKKNFQYTSKSLGIISGLNLLLLQLGINHTIHYRKEKQCYTIKTSEKHNARLQTKIDEQPYSGFVYDMSVKDNNNFVDACGQVLLHNTDSCFLKIPASKTKEDVHAFVKKVNAELPGVMELELEGFFKRGIFVTKESGEGAKKKYALIDEKNNLKIVGFEYVRRDWSGVAKETQREVIKAILEEGNPEKAARIVQKTIQDLKAGKTPREQLVVLTKIQRALGNYDSIGPHVAAARKAVQRGKKLGAGSMIGYIITRSGKSISDKAELEEYVQPGNYDADYYINNQVLPAVIRIMRELGYSQEDLQHGGKQQKLF